MSSEGSLWSWLRARLPRGHVSRIESDTSAGIPDVYFRNRSGPVWLELKFLRKKKLPFGEDGLRPGQIRWILDEVMEGGTVYIVADVRGTVFFIPGSHAAEFNDFSILMMEHWSVLTTRKRVPSRGRIELLLRDPKRIREEKKDCFTL